MDIKYLQVLVALQQLKKNLFLITEFYINVYYGFPYWQW